MVCDVSQFPVVAMSSDQLIQDCELGGGGWLGCRSVCDSVCAVDSAIRGLQRGERQLCPEFGVEGADGGHPAEALQR